MGKEKPKRDNHYYVALIERSCLEIYYSTELQENELGFLCLDSERFSERLNSGGPYFRPIYFYGDYYRYSHKAKKFVEKAYEKPDDLYIICTYDINPYNLSQDILLKGLKWAKMLEKVIEIGPFQ